jgi:hypothetical protein
MNNELFVSLYDVLLRKLAFDISDKALVRSVRIMKSALNRNMAPVILAETVFSNSTVYDGYYPLDEDSYRAALPLNGVIRFNQSNMFNNQIENRMKRLFTGGIDRRDGVCCFHCSLTLPTAPDSHERDLFWLFNYMDTFAMCLGIQFRPVRLEWYKSK